MSDSGRVQPELNVSFAALSGSSMRPSVIPPPNGTSRMDWSTSTTGMDGRAARRLSARSRSQTSVRADSFRRSEGRRMSQDTRRYMQAASASSQTTVQQLLARLQSYQTFQPFLALQAPYLPRAEEGQLNHRTSMGSVSRQRPAERTLTTPQLWQVMNGLLDTSVAHLLQHNAEGHFIVTLQSTLGRELTSTVPKVRTVIESRTHSTTSTTSGGAAAGAMTPTTSPPHRPSASGRLHRSAAANSNLLVDRWAAEHPEATAADIGGQREVWTAFEEKRRRDNRAFYLKAMQRQLNALQAEEAGGNREADKASNLSAGASAFSGSRLHPAHDQWDASSPGRLPDSSRSALALLEARLAQSGEEIQKDTERQRALWLGFQDKPSTTKSVNQPSPDAPRIVTAYLESEDLHHWLQSSWPHRTHRHESAALRIQCAYRGYRARCEVRVMRYARRQSFLVSLAAEKEACRVWDVALQVQADASAAVASSSDGTMRALRFFLDKINAVVAKRRARKRAQQEQDAEIRNYAAVCVQRVYRGHRARVYVNDLRHPEIIAERQRVIEERTVVAIQTCWRRHREERRWRGLRRAACTMQRAFRCRKARQLLAERRRLHAVAEVAALQRFAVHRIEVWYGRRLAARNAFAAAHRAEIHTLQRVCRGFADRKVLGGERRMCALRGAAAVVERRRRARLDAQAAVAVKSMLAEERSALLDAAMRGDAATTIQRAWRSRHCSADAAHDGAEEL